MGEPARLAIISSEHPTAAARDTSRPVLLIGFQRQSNLGLGYLASTLRSSGYEVEVLDFELSCDRILAAAQRLNPILVGFSLIFQSYIQHFGSLIRYLRQHGVNCHFTMGGHFPSLSYQHALALLPGLDSVVRFEGEMTLVELVDFLGTGRDWHAISGLAYRQNHEVVATPSRPLIADLDQLPYPERRFKHNLILGRDATGILASRGCARTCSFCSIHMFYRTAPGRVVRTRKPSEVVREMRFLLEEHGVSIFFFQDDDFPLFGPVWKRWAREFISELHRNGLPGRVTWKINCRADAVDPELFRELRGAGLFLVYMGLESGTEEGLDVLHKQISVEQNIRAVEILKEVGVIFDFGFMLLEPSSTFESVRANVAFLRTIAGDGSAAVTFGRMVPYDGTPIKTTLEREGRLRGDIAKPDYDFLDPRLTGFYKAISTIVDVTGWTHGYRALSPRLNFAWEEVATAEQLVPELSGLAAYKQSLREITRASNEVLFRVIEDTSYVYSDGRPDVWSADDLRSQCRRFMTQLVKERDAFVLRNQAAILRSSDREMQAACA